MSGELTERQAQVAGMMARGMTNKVIARELGISPATVKNHAHAVYGKLGVPRRGGVGAALANPRADVDEPPLWRDPVLYLLAGLAFGYLWRTFG